MLIMLPDPRAARLADLGLRRLHNTDWALKGFAWFTRQLCMGLHLNFVGLLSRGTPIFWNFVRTSGMRIRRTASTELGLALPLTLLFDLKFFTAFGPL